MTAASGHEARPDLNLGAAYVAAVLSGDVLMIELHRRAAEPDVLLDAIDHFLMIMGRRIAVDSDRTPTEVGDAFVAAAHVQQQVR